MTRSDTNSAPLPDFEGVKIIERLSSGQIADLYHAVQQPLGRPVLIKALSSSILPSSPFAATLEREARLLSELSHPNILHVHDFVRRDDRMWLVLEYVDGFSLDDLQKKLGKVGAAAAAAIALEITRALEHAHFRGVVHRDVQPKNVLVGKRGQLKLVNFAVAVDERLPTAPELLDGSASFGGPHYMSPEQILGEPADPRSDLFSLGVVLYELSSGKRPFDAPDERSTTQRIRHDAPQPLARIVPGIPSSLERVVARCLEKMPSDRFFSATELAQALEAVLAEIAPGQAPRAVISAALADAGLVENAAKSSAQPVKANARAAGPNPFRRAVSGLLVCAALIAVGGAVLSWANWRESRSNVGGARRLELAPTRAAYLRVVAEPWAHVHVDGQKVETTPFAKPIPLRAGTHYVRLEHPNAPAERRTIELVPGETVLLDVKMKVDKAALAASAPRDAGSDVEADAPPPSP